MKSANISLAHKLIVTLGPPAQFLFQIQFGVFSRGLAHTKRVPTRGSIPRWTLSLCRAVHLLQEDAPGIDRPAARLLELTWSRRLATDSYLQSEHATKHHVCSCLGGCHTGRRPWSARTGRAWLLGVSEESAPRPLEAFPGVQRKYGSDLSSGQSRVSQHLTGVGHPGTDRGWRATDIGHASRKRSSRAPS